MLTLRQVIDIVDAAGFKCATPVKGGPRPANIGVNRYGHHASYTKCVEGRSVTRVWGFAEPDKGKVFAQEYGAEVL